MARQDDEEKSVEIPVTWWEQIYGTFAGSEEAMRLGREYRESQRPNDEEQTAAD